MSVKETLTIENFLCINQLEIDLKRINIMIGPRSTGKSIVAKLLFYFKGFIWDLFSTVENEQSCVVLANVKKLSIVLKSFWKKSIVE